MLKSTYLRPIRSVFVGARVFSSDEGIIRHHSTRSKNLLLHIAWIDRGQLLTTSPPPPQSLNVKTVNFTNAKIIRKNVDVILI